MTALLAQMVKMAWMVPPALRAKSDLQALTVPLASMALKAHRALPQFLLTLATLQFWELMG